MLKNWFKKNHTSVSDKKSPQGSVSNLSSVRKLHIGAKQPHPGWEILDITAGPHVDHCMDINDLSSFDDETFLEIYASHVLEHFDYHLELESILAQWHRILKPGGKLYVSVPDMDKLCRLFIADNLTTEERFEVIRIMFGGHTDKYDYHKVGLNQELLESRLKEAGFINFKIVDDFNIFIDSSTFRFKNTPVSVNIISEKPSSNDRSSNTLEETSTIEPDDAEGHYQLGLALQDQGQREQAITHYQQALALKPDHAQAYNNLGNTYLELGQFEQAIDCYQRAFSLQPGYAEAYNNLGLTYLAQGQPEAALVQFKQAIALKPEFAQALHNLGYSYHELEQLEEAIRYYKQAITFMPDEPGFYRNLGHALQKLGKLDEALSQYEQAFKLNPENILAIDIQNNITISVPNDIQLMTPYILLEQEDWFENEIQFIRKLLRPGMNCIDIGANYGIYSLTMAIAIAPEGKIWSFEPTLSIVPFLRWSMNENRLDNMTIIEMGLSDDDRDAWLHTSSNSELNMVVDKSSKDAELIRLSSLDQCMRKYDWHDIDFVKIDAEGQGSNIIKGAKKFLTTHSPLVLFEIKEGDSLNMELVKQFEEIDYACYRLVPGLNILAPFSTNEKLDLFQLNLFCCKQDRAAKLAEAGLLTDKFPKSINYSDVDLRLWNNYLASFPYARQKSDEWLHSIDTGKNEGADEYLTALSYYVQTHQADHPDDSYSFMTGSLSMLEKSLDKHKNISRLQTYARILWELGARLQSLDILWKLASEFENTEDISLNEPFLAVSPIFERIDPMGHYKNWCLASVLEQIEQLRYYSSFFSNETSLQNIEKFMLLGFNTAGMERRKNLILKRFYPDSNIEINPILLEKSQGNLNPNYWS